MLAALWTILPAAALVADRGQVGRVARSMLTARSNATSDVTCPAPGCEGWVSWKDDDGDGDGERDHVCMCSASHRRGLDRVADRGADMVVTQECADFRELNCNRCCGWPHSERAYVPLEQQEDVVNATASAPDWQRRLGPDGQAHTHQEFRLNYNDGEALWRTAAVVEEAGPPEGGLGGVGGGGYPAGKDPMTEVELNQKVEETHERLNAVAANAVKLPRDFQSPRDASEEARSLGIAGYAANAWDSAGATLSAGLRGSLAAAVSLALVGLLA